MVDIGKIGLTMIAKIDSKISSPKSKTFYSRLLQERLATDGRLLFLKS